MSKLDHLLSYFNSHSHNNTAYILGNCLKMILFSVSHNNKVILFNIGFKHFRICSSHQNFSLCEISMLISLNHSTCNCFSNSSVLCSCSGQKITVSGIHVGLCNIPNCNKTFQLAFPVSDWKGNDTFLHHQIPCIFKRHTFICIRAHTDIHILYLGSNIRQISRRQHSKTI